MDSSWSRPGARALGRGVFLGLTIALTVTSIVAAPTGQVPVQIPRPPTTSETTAELTQTTWQWIRTEYSDDSTVGMSDPTRYTIVFGPDGTLSILADCNRVIGTYTRQAASITLRLGPSTLVACPPDSQADVFVRDLMNVATYVFSGSELVLNLRLDGGNMIFEAQPMTSFTETQWHVQSYNNGAGGVVSTLPQAQPSATFGADGTVAGSAGCNRYRGTYSMEGEALSFGPIATTRMACSPAIMEQERAFLAALGATTQLSRTADRLTLRDAGGSIQAVLIATA